MLHFCRMIDSFDNCLQIIKQSLPYQRPSGEATRAKDPSDIYFAIHTFLRITNGNKVDTGCQKLSFKILLVEECVDLVQTTLTKTKQFSNNSFKNYLQIISASIVICFVVFQGL